MRTISARIVPLTKNRGGWMQCRHGGRPRRAVGRSSVGGGRLPGLPAIQRGACAVPLRVHLLLMPLGGGGELDHVAVGVAEVNRVNEAVVDDAARVDTLRLALREHLLEER